MRQIWLGRYTGFPILSLHFFRSLRVRSIASGAVVGSAHGCPLQGRLFRKLPEYAGSVCPIGGYGTRSTHGSGGAGGGGGRASQRAGHIAPSEGRLSVEETADKDGAFFDEEVDQKADEKELEHDHGVIEGIFHL